MSLAGISRPDSLGSDARIGIVFHLQVPHVCRVSNAFRGMAVATLFDQQNLLNLPAGSGRQVDQIYP